MDKTNDIINWSEVSRLLTGDRSKIRSTYSKGKYIFKIKVLKLIICWWVNWQDKI